MTEGIAPLDVAVVGRDTLWVVDHMNALGHRGDAGYVRDFVTAVEAVDDLTPGHPAVMLVAPPTPDDDIDVYPALVAAHPEVAFVFTSDDPTDAVAARLAAINGTPPIFAGDREAVLQAVVAALHERRDAAGHAGWAAGGAAATSAAGDALVNGPAEHLRIVAVSAGKGGTGSTTVAINLAAALVEAGARVTVVDGHGAMGDVGFLLGLDKPTRMALELVEIDADSVPHYTQVHSATDLRAVVLPVDENELTTLTPRQLLELLVALGEHTDVVVIDLPLELLTGSDVVTYASKVVLVTTTHLASLKNTRIAADVIGRSHKLGVVRNDATGGGVDHGREAIEATLQVELLAELPFDDTIAEGAGADPVTAVSHPKSKYTKSVRRLADALLEGSFGGYGDAGDRTGRSGGAPENGS